MAGRWGRGLTDWGSIGEFVEGVLQICDVGRNAVLGIVRREEE